MKYILGVLSLLIAIVVFIVVHFEVPRPIGSVIVPLQSDGGLGNQMFRYAAGYALAKQTGSKLYVMVVRGPEDMDYTNPLDGKSALLKFNISKENIIYKNRINKKFFNYKYVNESNFFEISKKQNYETLIIHDDFESEIFFEEVKKDILEMFTLNSEAINIQDIIDKVSKENAVCMHVRRGDMYTKLKMYLIAIDYQKQAIKLINKIIANPSFFIFSDSIDVAKNELSDLNNATFINKSLLEDFLIMSKCGNNIIANSTFSWWAAYLNQNKSHITIAPFPRYTDYLLQTIFKDEKKREMKRKLYEQYAYPKGWIRLNYSN